MQKIDGWLIADGGVTPPRILEYVEEGGDLEGAVARAVAEGASEVRVGEVRWSGSWTSTVPPATVISGVGRVAEQRGRLAAA